MTVSPCVWPATGSYLLELNSFIVRGLMKASLTVSRTFVLCTYEARLISNTVHVTVSCTLPDAG